MLSFLKKPIVVTVGVTVVVLIGYNFVKSKNPFGLFGWLP